MREKYESLSLAVLKELAKSRGLKGISTLKKAALVERMLQEDEKEAQKAHAGEAEHDAEKKVLEYAIRYMDYSNFDYIIFLFNLCIF